ncbi:hypothetical protein BS47DRAFT_1254928, partial [Hydnum rufescens UP504]
YPFPTQPYPTAHQIFNLPRSASSAEIKSRYYELVKIYHPDSAQSHSVPPEIRQARFNSISSAYDDLRG